MTRTLSKGYYTLEQLAKKMKEAFKAYKVHLDIDLNTPFSGMIVHNPNNADIRVTQNLADLLDIQTDLKGNVYIKRLTSPQTYFVHCDLINKRQNLLNGKPSTVLARFDIRGQPFERVHYQTRQQPVLRNTDSGDYDVNSITLSVKDEKDNLFNFNGMPLKFEVEIT